MLINVVPQLLPKHTVQVKSIVDMKLNFLCLVAALFSMSMRT
jgi:hypothetical protein